MFLVVFIGIAAGTVAFFALPPHAHFGNEGLQNSIDDPWEMFFFVFSLMMTAYDIGSFTSRVSQFFALLFVIVQAVLLLNALIALMSYTTEDITENIQVVALRERAGIILEMELIMGDGVMSDFKYRPRWLHALVSDKDVVLFPAEDIIPLLCPLLQICCCHSCHMLVNNPYPG